MGHTSGRYETLKPESQDVVDAMIPKIRAHFGVPSTAEVIPLDIRMRTWDCERKEHVKDRSEDDPRNWGLQFLKDLLTISRVKESKLNEFQADLRKKVAFHAEEHPWVKLTDIKEIKEHYQHPEKPLIPVEEEPEPVVESSSDESYYELVEEERKGSKKHGRVEKVVKSRKMQKPKAKPVTAKSRKGSVKRVRRLSNGEWERPEKSGHHEVNEGSDYSSDDREVPARTKYMPQNFSDAAKEFQGMSVEEIQARLEVGEAELKTKRLRLALIEAKKKKKPENDIFRVKVEDTSMSEPDHRLEHVHESPSVADQAHGEDSKSHQNVDYARRSTSVRDDYDRERYEGGQYGDYNRMNYRYSNMGHTPRPNQTYDQTYTYEHDHMGYNQPAGGYAASDYRHRIDGGPPSQACEYYPAYNQRISVIPKPKPGKGGKTKQKRKTGVTHEATYADRAATGHMASYQQDAASAGRTSHEHTSEPDSRGAYGAYETDRSARYGVAYEDEERT